MAPKLKVADLEAKLKAKEAELQATQASLTKTEASRAKLKQYLVSSSSILEDVVFGSSTARVLYFPVMSPYKS